ncbi:MAG: T9SS type A sorting domain-containing protein, partial [Bacteroidia bacterium]|nr:T9SS type A sorting domain-containing protein [Bacteroidia bacterium]
VSPSPFAANTLLDEGQPSFLDEETSGDRFFNIFPNPTTGTFTLEIITGEESAQTHIRIYSMMGKNILEHTFTGSSKKEFSLAGEPGGIYLITFMQGDHVETAKVLKL